VAASDLALIRAVIAYAFREWSMKDSAARYGVSSSSVKRWLQAAQLRVRSSAEQRSCDRHHGRYDHASAVRAAWSRGKFDTVRYRATRKTTGDWGFPRNGESNPFFGRKHTKRTRAALSACARERCIASTGDYGPEWTAELREAIVRRDEFRCQLCGSNVELQVHHVDLDRSNSDPSNLLTLCARCHLGYHGRGERGAETSHAREVMVARLQREAGPC
jgi:5-methylcytosine-specific restriction endonuclease McrA